MIQNVEQIHQIDLYTVINEYVELKKNGSGYVGCCPFHNEKTPSFHVSPSKNIWKCFGCSVGGNSPVDFLQELKGMTYPEALEEAARIGRVEVEYVNKGNRTEFLARHKEEKRRRTELLTTLQALQNVYWNDTWAHVNFADQEQAIVAGRKYRFGIIREFGLAWVQEGIKKQAENHGLSMESLKELGVLRSTDRGVVDLFWQRSLFPIHDHQGRICGYGARKPQDDDSKAPKYINSPESIVYDKSNLLYGLFQSRRGIREKDLCILTEGYTDVLTCHEFGFNYTVATCGTALSDKQAQLIKRFTKNVLIIRDGDEAGRKATARDVEILARNGMNPRLFFLDEGQDPDTFLRKEGVGTAGMQYCIDGMTQDGIIWRIMQEWDENDNFKKQNAYRIAAEILGSIESESLVNTYLTELTKKSRMGAVKMMLKSAMKEYQEAQFIDKSPLNDRQKRDVLNFGLYIENNCYYMAHSTEGEGMQISNFIIVPIMLVIGAEQSQRLFEIVNEYGKRHIINIPSEKLTTLNDFKKVSEGKGNFRFTGKTEDFERVKAKVYHETSDCFPITIMGLHREGFYSWGNGISYQNEFFPVNEYGIVKHQGTNYFLPAFSNLQANIKSDDVDETYEFEKKFSFHPAPASISVRDWSLLMQKVHGTNGAMGVAWYVASLFRDIIFNKFQFFPHLFLFGPSGAGKTFMARSVMAMFGKGNHQDPFNLTSGTPVAFKRRLAQVSNGIVWFDEYSNGVDLRRVEALKGAYDGAGHEKGIATNDNRTKTTKVKSALLVSGQQQPTADIALLKRVILLSFKSGTNSLEKQQIASKLKDYEKTGQLTQITQCLAQYRDLMEDKFSDEYDRLRRIFNRTFDAEGYRPEDRIINNTLIPLTAANIISEKLDFGFDIAKLQEIAYQNIIDQTESIFNEDELSIFWRIVEYLHQKGINDPKSGIHHKEDILVESRLSETFQNEANRKDRKDSLLINFEEEKTVIYIRFTKLHPEYQDRHQRQRNKPGLDLQALKYYLKNSDAYLGQKRSKKFGASAFSCFAFDMEKLGIEIPLSLEIGEEMPEISSNN